MTNDAAVIGAGIVGLAHAYHLARRGLRVLVVERSERAEGASIRNFGMIWPIGQPAGPRHRLAVQSRAWWLEVLNRSKLWFDPVGSLHLAYAEEEEAVLREFTAPSAEHQHSAEWLDAESAREMAPAVNPAGLRGGIFSGTEICVDPRQVVRELPEFLAREYGVGFRFSEAAVSVEGRRVVTTRDAYDVDQVFVCSGDDFESLFAPLHRESGLFRCKLQMMRSVPLGGGQRLGPMLAAGLTLVHYGAFAGCESLPRLRAYLEGRYGDYLRYGIHVMTSQNGRGEVVIGDSHEYGGAIEPFNKEEIDALILAYLRGFLDLPGLQIASRWHGCYAKHPTEPYWVARPSPGVTIATGLGGAGMTLSFGLADRVVRETLGDS
ncbi:MAG: TIGR03364 family FAD-dependent oxidoreductase [Isosphaeraceae bacterium]